MHRKYEENTMHRNEKSNNNKEIMWKKSEIITTTVIVDKKNGNKTTLTTCTVQYHQTQRHEQHMCLGDIYSIYIETENAANIEVKGHDATQ